MHRQLPAWSIIKSHSDTFHISVISHRQYKSGLSKLYLQLVMSEGKKKTHQGNSLYRLSWEIQLLSLHGEDSCQTISLKKYIHKSQPLLVHFFPQSSLFIWPWGGNAGRVLSDRSWETAVVRAEIGFQMLLAVPNSTRWQRGDVEEPTLSLEV